MGAVEKRRWRASGPLWREGTYAERPGSLNQVGSGEESEFSAQSPQFSDEFSEIEGGCCPGPFGLHFL